MLEPRNGSHGDRHQEPGDRDRKKNSIHPARQWSRLVFLRPILPVRASPAGGGAPSVWKESIADVARCWGQSDPSRLAPDRLVDLLLVADLQPAGDLLGQEDRIVHLAAGSAVPGFHLLPEFEWPEFELRQLFSDLSAKALPFTFTGTPSAPRKHPESIPPSSNKQHPPLLRGHKF